MGTNYYCRRKTPTKVCGEYGHRLEAQERLHIGKSSGGWCFALHVLDQDHPDKPQSLEDWVTLFVSEEWTIEDEYGQVISPEEMLRSILHRRGRGQPQCSIEWLNENHAQGGPNGLVRHQLGHGCIKHGPGTYDLIVGEFF